MGTRGALGVRIGGVDKITYCHFDCYPEGLGKSIVSDVRAMLRDPGLDGMRQLASDLRVVSPESRATHEEIEKFDRFADHGVGSKDPHDWYVLLRELQGEFQGTLQAGVMIDSTEFLADSLFCEYAYIVNLDDVAFECYRGFQREAHSKGRYAAMDRSARSTDYWPVALVGSFDLADIPRNWAKQAFPSDEED